MKRRGEIGIVAFGGFLQAMHVFVRRNFVVECFERDARERCKFPSGPAEIFGYGFGDTEVNKTASSPKNGWQL